MTLPASGAITSTQIKTELSLGSSNLVVPSTEVRDLTGVAAGSIVWPDDFWGKSSQEVSFEGSVADTDTSVAGVPIGTAKTNRRVIVTIGFTGSGSPANSPTVSNVVIGGVAAVVHAQSSNHNSTSGLTVGQAIASALIPTGTTATVAWSVSHGSVTNSVVGAWRVIGSPSSTPNDTYAENANALNKPAEGTLNVPAGGFVILAAAMFGTDSIVLSPSSTQVINEDGGSDKFKASWQSGLSADAAYAVSATWSTAATNGMGMASLAWDM